MDLARTVLMGGHYRPKKPIPGAAASVAVPSVRQMSDLRSKSETVFDFSAETRIDT
jgi:hypothetical protein